MKNRIIAALLLSGVLMTACADNTVTDLDVLESSAEGTAAIDAGAEESGAENSDAGAVEPGAGESMADESDNSLYESFLKNEVKVHYDASKEGGRPNDVPDGDYSLSELVDAIKAAHDGFTAMVESIDYSYIDCCNDGAKELILSVDAPDCGDGWDQTVVIKNVDGVLNLIYSNDRRVKEQLDINDCGYVSTSGGDGYGYLGAGSGVINNDGYHSLYYVCAAHMNYSDDKGDKVWIDGSDIELPAGLGIGDDFYLIEYGVENTSDGSVDKYYSYAQITDRSITSVGCFDLTKVECSDESIYADTNPFRQYLESQGLKVCSVSEIVQMMADRDEALGVTDEIKNAGTEQWQTLDYNF